jgi:hypothetical protein
MIKTKEFYWQQPGLSDTRTLKKEPQALSHHDVPTEDFLQPLID